MGEFDDIDFFRGDELIADPYPYFDHLRSGCPVQREPKHGVVMVTGYEEAVSVYTNTSTFSSCNCGHRAISRLPGGRSRATTSAT